MDVAKIFKKTPYLADLKPGGKYVAKDMWEAGGVPMLLKTLYDGGFIHGECMTVTGKTIKENLKNIKFNKNSELVNSLGEPYAVVHQYDKRWTEFSDKVNLIKKQLGIF